MSPIAIDRISAIIGVMVSPTPRRTVVTIRKMKKPRHADQHDMAVGHRLLQHVLRRPEQPHQALGEEDADQRHDEAIRMKAEVMVVPATSLTLAMFLAP